MSSKRIPTRKKKNSDRYIHHTITRIAVVLTITTVLQNCDVSGKDLPDEQYPQTDHIEGNSTPASTIWRDQIRLAPLHSAHFFGQGQLVAVIDTGLDRDAMAFSGRIHGDSINLTGVGDGDYQDPYGHGTQMAGIIVGHDANYTGVAPDADILAINIASPNGHNMLRVGALIDGLYYATDRDADVINLSIGGDIGGLSDLRDAVQYATDHGVVVVTATGNEGNNTAPENIAEIVGLPAYGGLLIAVTAVDDNSEIASFASPCDVPDPRYCLAAPGVAIDTVNLGGGYTTVSGTSPATAIVSGGVTLLRQYWSDLTPEQAVEILLVSADDLGAVGVDRVYGSGLINLEAAMSPIGTVSLAQGAEITDLAATQVNFGAIGANTASIADALDDIAIQDAFDRGFNLDLSARVVSDNAMLEFGFGRDEPKLHFTHRLGADGQITIGSGVYDDKERNPFHTIDVAMRQNPFDRITVPTAWAAYEHSLGSDFVLSGLVGYGRVDDNDHSIARLGLRGAVTPQLTLDFGAGVLTEKGAALGIKMAGALGAVTKADSQFIQIGARYEYDKFAFMAHYTDVHTTPDYRAGAIGQALSPLSADSWGVAVTTELPTEARDRFGIGVGRGLALYDGGFTLDQGHGAHQINLADQGDNFIVEMAYEREIDRNINLISNIALREDGETAIGLFLQLTF